MEADRTKNLIRERLGSGFIDRYSSINSIYLSGSLARGDYVAGFSDVDLVVIGEKVSDSELRDLEKHVSDTLAGVDTSIRHYNAPDLARERVEAYLLSLDSQLLAGTDILAKAKKPGKEEIQAYGKRMLDRQIGDWIAHL